MIERALAGKLATMAESFPVVTLTGPRQSGKSTLVKATFPGYRYVSLEDPDIRALAREDPRSFLKHYDERVIIDEAQHVPELFSYMQGAIDARDTPGRYILSGSQNFLLMKSISQSLAGRAAVLHLLPLSHAELRAADIAPESVDDYLLAGGYPRIHAHALAPADFFPSYIATYLERDVRAELGVRKISEFSTFLSLCAARTGQLLSLDGLARDCGVNVDTARGWLSLLQQSFVVFLLRPYHRNYGKRLVKAPKLYFHDTGLAASLLGIESSEELFMSDQRGALYENCVISELVKAYYTQGREPRLFYWRDSAGNEIDLVVEKGGRPAQLVEVKASATYKASALSTIDKLGDAMQVGVDGRFVVYGGDETMETTRGTVVGLTDVDRIAC